MDPLAVFFAGSITLLVFAGLGALSFRSWRFGIGVILSIFVWRAAVVTLPQLDLGPASVYPDDAFSVILLLVTLLRLARDPDLFVKRLPWIGFGILGAISLFIGIGRFGVRGAGNEARVFINFFTAVLYCSSFRLGPKALEQFAQVVNFFSIALLALAGIRWAQMIGGIPIHGQFLARIDPNPVELTSPFRVLYHSEALFLGQSLLLNLWLTLRNPKRSWLYIGVLTASMVILQHRTSWVMMMLLGGLIIGRHARRGKTVFILAGGVVLSVIAVLIMAANSQFDSVTSALMTSLDEPFRGRSTFLWRIEGWKQLLARPLTDFITGDPFGSGFWRVIDHVHVVFSPHNYYIETVLRLGIIGLGLLVTVYALAIWQSTRRRAFPEQEVVWFLLASQLIYFITYNATLEQGVILGMGLAITAAKAPACAAIVKRIPRPYFPFRLEHALYRHTRS